MDLNKRPDDMARINTKERADTFISEQIDSVTPGWVGIHEALATILTVNLIQFGKTIIITSL